MFSQKTQEGNGNRSLDVLFVTCNRPWYARVALEGLLAVKASCSIDLRLWVWRNGEDPETAALVEDLDRDDNFHSCIRSRRNVGLADPTNWFLSRAESRFLSKVDDDCLVPPDWASRLVEAHEQESKLGVLGAWHFRKDELVPELVARKTRRLSGGVRILHHPWVGGSGFVLKRAALGKRRRLPRGRWDFPSLQLDLARRGWINGWLLPPVLQDHMDDPRSDYYSPDRVEKDGINSISAARRGIQRVEDWNARLRQSARDLQELPSHTFWYGRLGRPLRRLWKR